MESKSRVPENRRAVLVTAGCGGLGKSIWEHLACNGWNVFPTTRDLSSVAVEENTTGNRGLFPAQLSFEDPVCFSDHLNAILNDMESRGLLLSGVVHCAASRTRQKPMEDLEEEDWLEEFRVSVIRFSQIALAAAERMRRHGVPGSLVALSSIYGHHAVDRCIYDDTMLRQGLFSGIPYAVSKAGMEHLVRCLALELGGAGIRVNAVASGGIENPEKQTGFFREKYIEKTPLRRLGKGSDIPGAVDFLLSPASSYISGHILPVDGGWCAR
ncbi:MAG: SDR family oxidoreductase [Synergistales bacterium]|nr:SDR family oxidoreductase [Synergistales bacterium]